MNYSRSASANHVGSESRFFSFANTVRARGYQDSGECHGWLAVRFQEQVFKESGTILLHVRLLDEENVDQMEALGILGVNLIWAAYHHSRDLSAFRFFIDRFPVGGTG